MQYVTCKDVVTAMIGMINCEYSTAELVYSVMMTLTKPKGSRHILMSTGLNWNGEVRDHFHELTGL